MSTGKEREKQIFEAFQKLIPNPLDLAYFLEDNGISNLFKEIEIESKLLDIAKEKFAIKKESFDLSLENMLSIRVQENELYSIGQLRTAYFVGEFTKVQVSISDYQQMEEVHEIVEEYLPLALELNVAYIEFWS